MLPMKVFDALGNPVRREILELLRDGPLPVSEIAAVFPVSRPAISRHLRLLTDAELVSRASAGNRNLYALTPAGFESARDYLESFWDTALARFKLVAENVTREDGP